MTYKFSSHAVSRMFERNISKNLVIKAIKEGEVINDYPADKPFPSRLVLDFNNGNPLHVVFAEDINDSICYIITVYHPDSELWTLDYKTRRNL